MLSQIFQGFVELGDIIVGIWVQNTAGTSREVKWRAHSSLFTENEVQDNLVFHKYFHVICLGVVNGDQRFWVCKHVLIDTVSDVIYLISQECDPIPYTPFFSHGNAAMV